MDGGVKEFLNTILLLPWHFSFQIHPFYTQVLYLGPTQQVPNVRSVINCDDGRRCVQEVRHLPKEAQVLPAGSERLNDVRCDNGCRRIPRSICREELQKVALFLENPSLNLASIL